MKKTKTCPKCDSHNIIVVPGSVGLYGVGNNVPTGWSILSSVRVTRYLCGECGFSEEWIDSLADIDKIRNKYGK